jgi:hypothetical protein
VFPSRDNESGVAKAIGGSDFDELLDSSFCFSR